MKRFGLLLFSFIFVLTGFAALHITNREPKPVKQFYSCYAEEVESCDDNCSICVVGRASKKISPDCAYFLIRIERSDKDIFTSQNACYDIYQNIISVASEFDIPKENFCEHGIISRQFKVEPAEYKTVFDFEVKTCDIDCVNSFKNKIQEFDDCRIFDLQYSASNISEECDRTLEEAIENANQKASQLLHREGQKIQIVAQNVFSVEKGSDIEIKAMVEIMYE